MSIKNDLLKEIEKKASRIREKRTAAASVKTIERYIAEFFKDIEDARSLNNNDYYDYNLVSNAHRSLESKLKNFDKGVKTALKWSHTEEDASALSGYIIGVTIWWSSAHIAKNNCDPSLYMDAGSLLFN